MLCSFCNNELPKGSGIMFVRKNGDTEVFCSSKCKNNVLHLKREGRHQKWTAKTVALVHEKKVVEKKESAFAKEVAAKLAEKAAAKEEKK